MSGEPSILRILDANLNRAREGLRVVEEYARFVLADAGLSESIKQLRHDLVASVPKTVGSALHTHRDSRGDVGREVSTASEMQRGHAGDVARASAARVTEALRSIEEYGKTVDVEFAARVESLRYRAYELERRLTLTCTAQDRCGHIRLYVIITEAFCRRDWFETATLALEGGADALQLREKTLPDAELLRRAQRIAALCRERQALFIVNDRPDIALLSRADGVHVGQEDTSVADLRRLLPASMIVGVSTHTKDQIRAAAQTAPDYIAVGPMFATATKPQEHIAGPQTLAFARGLTSLPLVAIGGITLENAAQVLSAAPCALCICSAVIAADDPLQATRRLAELQITNYKLRKTRTAHGNMADA